MSINIANFSKLIELISLSQKRKPKIVLNPEDEFFFNNKKGNDEDINVNIEVDKTKWKITEDMYAFVNELSQNGELSNEEKILEIYKKLCEDYIYDDNVLSYIQKTEDDKYALPDWYGRDIDSEWWKKREEHKRRVCYEVSRYLAKALMVLFKDNDNFNICILWDKDLTHYYVGLTCNDYSITLDLDDFNNIKDLTRAETGLTFEGINILSDNESKFKNALNKLNKDRNKHAIKMIQTEIKGKSVQDAIPEEQQSEEPDDIIFLRNAIEILKEKFNLDSQGIFEFMKEIVDIKVGPEARKKVWKRLGEDCGKNTIYTRCLLVKSGSREYMIDVDEKIVRLFNMQEFKKENAEFIPFKELHRNWNEISDGR